MRDFLFFNKMLTRNFILFIYWLWLAAAWVAALVFGFKLMMEGGIMLLLGPIVFVLIGALESLVARICCELMIVSFEIHAQLTAVRNVIAPTGPAPSGFPVGIVTPAPGAQA